MSEPRLPLSVIQDRSMASATRTTRESWPSSDALTQPEIERLLEMRRYAVMATTRPDGHAHAVPVAFLHIDGRIWLGSAADTRHLRNVRRDPALSLVVMGSRDDEHHVALVVEGEVRFADDAEAARAAIDDRWSRRYGHGLEWADVVFELVPAKVFSHGRGRLEGRSQEPSPTPP
jgi:general stress protein 26